MKEVFWIKTSSKKKRSKPKKKTVKKLLKKTIKKTPLKAKPAPILKLKPVKIPKVVKQPKALQIDPQLVNIGEITHYFDRIKVCVVKINQGTVLVGDKLTIVGKSSKFIQKVWSMQIESVDVKVAKKGQLIGLKIDKPATVGDIVYK